jgi:hypothetical protein
MVWQEVEHLDKLQRQRLGVKERFLRGLTQLKLSRMGLIASQ